MADTRKFKHLGDYLKRSREASDLSQGVVAKKLGYKSPQFVSNFERGLCSPPVKQLKTLVSLYDLSGDQLIRAITEDHRATMRDSVVRLKKVLRIK